MQNIMKKDELNVYFRMLTNGKLNDMHKSRTAVR